MATRMPKGNWSEYSVYGNLSTKEDNKVKRAKEEEKKLPKNMLAG